MQALLKRLFSFLSELKNKEKSEDENPHFLETLIELTQIARLLKMHSEPIPLSNVSIYEDMNKIGFKTNGYTDAEVRINLQLKSLELKLQLGASISWVANYDEYQYRYEMGDKQLITDIALVVGRLQGDAGGPRFPYDIMYSYQESILTLKEVLQESKSSFGRIDPSLKEDAHHILQSFCRSINKHYAQSKGQGLGESLRATHSSRLQFERACIDRHLEHENLPALDDREAWNERLHLALQKDLTGDITVGKIATEKISATFTKGYGPEQMTDDRY